jgi:multidrug resistance efflux pump
VEWFDLIDYADVSKGQVLLRLGPEDYEEQIASLELQVKNAQEDVDEALDALAKFNALSLPSKDRASLNVSVGQEVTQGTTAVSIANTTS